MNYNDVLRSIRYTFDLSDSKMIEIFSLANLTVTRSEVSDWLKREDDPEQKGLYDQQLAYFLNGLIIEKRGRREGPQPIVEKNLNNNIILRKLKIALNLKDDDILNILRLVDVRLSKHELSAFFRNPKQTQFRLCHDQFLRNFLKGMRIRYRDNMNKS